MSEHGKLYIFSLLSIEITESLNDYQCQIMAKFLWPKITFVLVMMHFNFLIIGHIRQLLKMTSNSP